MPSQTTLTLGSMAPGARVRPEHLTPVELPPLPVYCAQGEIATLTSCTPPWMRLGVTYLRPRLAPPEPTFIRVPVPWLMILSVATLAAIVAIAAAHLLSVVAEVHTVDSALASHADDLAPIDAPRAARPAPPPPRAEPEPPVVAPMPPETFPRNGAESGWVLELPEGKALPLPPPLEHYHEEVRRQQPGANR